MAYFTVTPTSTTGVDILGAASLTKAAGLRPRFIALGFSNGGAGQVTLKIFDGTASGGTAKFIISLAPGAGDYQLVQYGGGRSVIPKDWFTANNAIECNISGTGSVTVFGELVLD